MSWTRAEVKQQFVALIVESSPSHFAAATALGISSPETLELLDSSRNTEATPPTKGKREEGAMGKNKRKALSSGPKKQKPSQFSQPQGVSKSQSKSKALKHTQAQHTKPTIPFSPSDRILLIGEGDLSFARSIVEHHKCSNIIATVYESASELLEKYPHVASNIEFLRSSGEGVSIRFGVDATKMKPWVEGKRGGGIMDRIIFNFPHVGGKSTDVNRQVRYNQELLVSFFRHAIPSLSPNTGSSVVITLFEGEPYTLWNIRDLARHAGMEVKESFRFQAKAYPGYRHARTLGVVRGKDGEVREGERRGWRGEKRAARSFVFVRKGEGQVMGTGKRKRGESESESERSEDEDEGHGADGYTDEPETEGEGWEGFEDGTDEEKYDDD